MLNTNEQVGQIWGAINAAHQDFVTRHGPAFVRQTQMLDEIVDGALAGLGEGFSREMVLEAWTLSLVDTLLRLSGQKPRHEIEPERN